MTANLPLNALRAFEAVARLHSFSAAAAALFVTQSAVSHQVRHLEDWLGSPLFDRSGARPRLLPHGAELARALAGSLGQIDAACRKARAGARAEPLVIAAIPSVAVCWLIPRLAQFRTAHPEIDLRVVYAMHGRDIDFRDVHLAFVFATRAPVLASVTARAFLPGVSVPVCAPGLLAGRRMDRPEQIAALGLLHDADHGGWAAWFAQTGVAMPPQIGAAVFEDFNLLRAAALAGQGAALCPVAMIRPDLDAGRLVQLSALPVRADFSYYLLNGAAPDSPLAAPAAAFVDWAFGARDHLDPILMRP